MKGDDSMARPSKPVSVLKKEKASHRTSAELKSREKQEKASLSGCLIREFAETKKNSKAHTEFNRVVELLSDIEKNDAVYETVINRYCVMLAECTELQNLRTDMSKMIKEMKKLFKENVLSALDVEVKANYSLDFADKLTKLTYKLLDIDKQIQTKRTMLLSIEKECGMTIAASLRMVDKKPEEKKSALLTVLSGGGNG